MGPKGAVEIIFRSEKNDPAKLAERELEYREKFAKVTPLLASVMDVALPDAGFYLWAAIPEVFKGSDTAFSTELLSSAISRATRSHTSSSLLKRS